jgi:lysophospholipase L1-like esterase
MSMRIPSSLLTLVIVLISGAAASAQTTAPSTAPTTRPDAITLHLAGDSTVMTYADTSQQRGWGQEIGALFTDKIVVNNRAVGGASVQTFKNGNWNRIMSAIKAGDYVMIQFGANDSGTVPGRHVSVEDFGKMYATMADEVKAKGANPIFVTPSAFFQWVDGKQDNKRLAPYAEAIVAQGKAKDIPVVDLNARGVEFLSSIGQDAAFKLYMPSGNTVDKAHFVKGGSTKMAELVAQELRRIKSPLAEHLK